MTECGLTNLASCLPESFFQFLVGVLTAPVEPFLILTKALLTEPVNINIFQSLWAIIIYLISLFYGLFFIFAGFNFLISGYDASKRENAKMWLRNVILMIIFVQSSFFIYDLIIELGALLTTGVMDMIDPSFFLVMPDNYLNIGVQLISILVYLLVLLLTIILLGLRYFIVSVGVVLFPIGIFLYFIPPLQSYGKMILNILLVAILVPFFDVIILLGASKLTDIPIFTNSNLIVASISFLAINSVMVILAGFVIVKTALPVLNSQAVGSITKAVKYLV